MVHFININHQLPLYTLCQSYRQLTQSTRAEQIETFTGEVSRDMSDKADTWLAPL